MGYTTDFDGVLDVTPAMKPEHIAYLNRFSATRRMARRADVTATMPDPLRAAVGLPVGEQGGYFVGAADECGQDRTRDIVEYNRPPAGQPGLWCNWVIGEDGNSLEWNGGEKFYSYVEWLNYLVQHFLTPWGYRLDGTISWQGEESTDIGKIVVKNNKVSTKRAKVVFEDDGE